MAKRQLNLIKKGHHYIILYEPGEESSVIQCLMDKVKDKESGLDWFDAAVLSHQMGYGSASEMQKRMGKKSK